jgi:hypothetical protein
MPELLTALDAFMQEHRRCGELDGGVEPPSGRSGSGRLSLFRTLSKQPQSVHLIQVRVAGANVSSQNIVSKR